ncbi:MAG: 16S rRNA (adenine(1518)-N(6)/adenine(1519)-N(6))-dimethyltransferase RsmA [Clostridia bacterium]|nr:16S rRNA (adenine(1518)-N(6)/adenine(1519)-N(6))-dimethyltransferase RsmA [Clostridia bacterium]
MELSNINELKGILSAEGFSFKKSLGQNFLMDDTVCPKMAESAADCDTGVIEIGPGAGVLTRELAKRAKRVVAIELDERLKNILEKTIGEFDNVKLIFSDVLKVDLHSLIKEEFSDCKSVNICANLPYYITSPIIMSLLQSRLNIGSITVMVQKEAADRLCADVGSRDAGAVTVAVNYYSKTEILFKVPRESFLPSPNVDSAVIKLNILPSPPINVADEKKFFAFVKACFAQRRKTLINTVSNTLDISKDSLKSALDQLNIPQTVRAEQLTMEDLSKLSNILFI